MSFPKTKIDPNRSLVEQINELNASISEEELKKLYDICQIPKPQPKPRFEEINDSYGSWIRDNETGLEFSKRIGIPLFEKVTERI